MGKTHRNHKNAKGPTPQLRSRNTRSSKGRLLTGTSSSTTQLTNQLSLLGLYAAPTIGDGNCLFRALSDQLYGSPSQHHELRQQICDHIAKHKSRYEPFVEDERGLESHLRAMRENATYGGHMELSAFAHMTRRNVKVIQPGLVYVIEWRAAGWEEAAAAADSAAGANTSEEPESSNAPRRTLRKSVSPAKGKEETKNRLGKGYFGSEEEEDVVKVKVEEVEDALKTESPTVYVAYHDWEHFSSIRNLRGPHTGLPNVVETPPPSLEDPEQPVTPKTREKEKDRERKKERERKEKERKEKERERKLREKNEKDAEAGTSSGASAKVKLKLPPSVANASIPDASSSSSLTPAVSSSSGSPPRHDPSLIPLPISRSASPFIGTSSSLVTSSAASPLPSSSLANEFYPEDPSPNAHISTPEGLDHGHRHPHAHILQTPRSQYRSPKRSFDESSASGGEEDPENSKRSRRRRVGSGGWSGTGVDGTADVSNAVGDGVVTDKSGVVDIAMDVGRADEADTPSLCVLGSNASSPLSSVASSVASSASSEVDVDDDEVELESQPDDPDNEITAKLPPPTQPEGHGKKARQQYLRLHRGNHAGDRPLTRRQRKALGLPKPRRVVTGTTASGGADGTTSLSAGKIVIPGGKWKGKGDGPEQTTAGVAPTADSEWTRNGTGRLDVRGFRELKI